MSYHFRRTANRIVAVVLAAAGFHFLGRADNGSVRALNRRVEVLVTEELIDDYAGTTLSDDLRESSRDGR